MTRRGRHGHDTSAHRVVDGLQPAEVDVEHGDLRAEAEEGARGVAPRDARTEDHHIGRRDAGDAAEEDPTAFRPVLADRAGHRLEERSGDDRRQPARHLARGMQDRQRSVVGLDHLVGDGGDGLFAQGGHQIGRRHRQVQEREQRLALEVRVLLGGWTRDFHHDLGAPPDLLARVDKPGAGPSVLLIMKACPHAGAGLHVRDMAGLCQRMDAGRGEADPMLIRPDFCWHAELHEGLPGSDAAGSRSGAVGGAGACPGRNDTTRQQGCRAGPGRINQFEALCLPGLCGRAWEV